MSYKREQTKRPPVQTWLTSKTHVKTCMQKVLRAQSELAVASKLPLSEQCMQHISSSFFSLYLSPIISCFFQLQAKLLYIARSQRANWQLHSHSQLLVRKAHKAKSTLAEEGALSVGQIKSNQCCWDSFIHDALLLASSSTNFFTQSPWPTTED